MKIEADIYNCALQHLTQRGDTDLFPYPFELKFFEEFTGNIIDSLAALDLSSYHPMSLVESLVPKTKFGFRVAHQVYPVDALIYTSLVLKIFDDVESGRDPQAENRAFSYRKAPGLDPAYFYLIVVSEIGLRFLKGICFLTNLAMLSVLTFLIFIKEYTGTD